MLNSMARSAKNVEMGTPWHQEFVETHPQVARMFDQVMEYVTNVNKVISNQDTDASKINLKMIAAMCLLIIQSVHTAKEDIMKRRENVY